MDSGQNNMIFLLHGAGESELITKTCGVFFRIQARIENRSVSDWGCVQLQAFSFNESLWGNVCSWLGSVGVREGRVLLRLRFSWKAGFA